MIEGVTLQRPKVVSHPLGDVYRVLRQADLGFAGFGEAYFSTVPRGTVKGWKKHLRMTLNIVVPVGAIKFVLFDDRVSSVTKDEVQELELSLHNYQRLTVPPGVWMAFQGTGEDTNMLLNVADIVHDPEESENKDLGDLCIPYQDWTL